MEASRQKQKAIFFGFSVIHFFFISFLFFKHRIINLLPSLREASPSFLLNPQPLPPTHQLFLQPKPLSFPLSLDCHQHHLHPHRTSSSRLRSEAPSFLSIWPFIFAFIAAFLSCCWLCVSDCHCCILSLMLSGLLSSSPSPFPATSISIRGTPHPQVFSTVTCFSLAQKPLHNSRFSRCSSAVPRRNLQVVPVS